MSLVIREATAQDSGTLLDLIDALADYEKLPRPTPDARDRLVRDGFGQRPRFRTFLAELDGTAVGYAIVLHTYSTFLARPTLYVEDIFLLPEARGHGHGRAIMTHLARLALEEDCGRMEWAVLDWNQPAIDFYERIGAGRLREWLPYRLDREQIEALASSAAS